MAATSMPCASASGPDPQEDGTHALPHGGVVDLRTARDHPPPVSRMWGWAYRVVVHSWREGSWHDSAMSCAAKAGVPDVSGGGRRRPTGLACACAPCGGRQFHRRRRVRERPFAPLRDALLGHRFDRFASGGARKDAMAGKSGPHTSMQYEIAARREATHAGRDDQVHRPPAMRRRAGTAPLCYGKG